MVSLSLSLLGTLQVTRSGQAVARFRSAKVLALLAYLVVEGRRPHRREVLAGLLWPEKPDRVALNNLRYTLSHLRTAIGDRQAAPPFLLITRETIQFNTASAYRLDVDDFQACIGNLVPGGGPAAAPRSEIESLKSAIALYRGPFLDGFSLSGSPAFEEWILYKREQYHRQALEALQRLALFYDTRGEIDPAEAYTRRYLELEPWHEDAHRRLMRLLAQRGQRGAALAQYETCRRLLAAGLGVEPEVETQLLCERIRDGEVWKAEIRQPAAVATEPAAPGAVAFAGRERELARLDGFLDRALTGQGQVVLVAGSAGSGKTALLREFARRALAHHGALIVALGSGSAQAGIGDPYLVFREIVQMLAGQIESRRASSVLSPEHARRLWRLLPVVVQALVEAGPDLIGRLVPAESLALRIETHAPGGAALRARVDEVARSRRGAAPPAPAQEALFEQVTRVLHTIARHQPLVLVLDDLQWADSSSASLLFHLGRRLAGSRILLVGAYRPVEVTADYGADEHPLRPILREFQRDLGDIEVDLDQAEGRAFVDAFLDAQPNDLRPPFRDRLYRLTGGHALFTVELVREMQERGGLVHDAAGRWEEGAALDWVRLPSRVEAVIAGRVDRLPAAWQQMLAVASVEGEVFTAQVVARVQGLDEAEVIGRLSGPLSRRYDLVAADSLERLDGQRLSRYRFRHHLFQVYLYGRLDAVERATLHESVGQAMEALYGAAAAPRLAFHFEAAGLAAKAADYLLQAGQRAYLLSASREAVALYRHALALLDHLPPGNERDRREMDLQLALSRTSGTLRGWGAREHVEPATRASELGRRLGDPDRLLPALLHQAGILAGEGKSRQALDLSRQALGLAQQAQDLYRQCVAHQRMGLSRFFLGELTQAREHLARAADLWREPSLGLDSSSAAVAPGSGEVPVQLPHILIWSCHTLWMLGYPDQALAHSQEAVAGAPALPGERLRIVTHARLAFYAYRGDVPAMLEASERMLFLAKKDDLPVYQAYGTAFRGWALARQGQTEAIASMRAGIAALRAGGTFAGLFLLMALLAEALLYAGQPQEGLSIVDKALALTGQFEARSYIAEMHRLRGELWRAQGARRQAEACFQQAIEVARQQEARSWELRATTSLARLWQAQGRGREAQPMLAGIYGWFSEGFDTSDLVAARALLDELGTHHAPLMRRRGIDEHHTARHPAE